MKLPAGAIAAAFAGGIALGLASRGARHASSLAFLSLSSVAVALLLATGMELQKLRHPSPELLERLEKAGIRIYRTDSDGAVHVLTDGTRLKICCFAEYPEARNDTGTSTRAEIPNQKQDGEKK
jgi:hypothetical protein